MLGNCQVLVATIHCVSIVIAKASVILSLKTTLRPKAGNLVTKAKKTTQTMVGDWLATGYNCKWAVTSKRPFWLQGFWCSTCNWKGHPEVTKWSSTTLLLLLFGCRKVVASAVWIRYIHHSCCHLAISTIFSSGHKTAELLLRHKHQATWWMD